MKKISILVLSMFVITAFTACGKKEAKKSETVPVSEQKPAEEIPVKNNMTEEKTSNGHMIYVFNDSFERWVKTDGSNLNYRANPVDGEKLGHFVTGDRLKITKKTQETFTIDGITEAWYYGMCYADVEPYGGWVFGGYLVDSVEALKEKASEYYGDDDYIDLDCLVGDWENERTIVRIKDNKDFFLGVKESEGFGGRWSMPDDDLILVENCSVYDEDPWDVSYRIKVCTPNRLVLERTEDDWLLELTPEKSMYNYEK